MKARQSVAVELEHLLGPRLNYHYAPHTFSPSSTLSLIFALYCSGAVTHVRGFWIASAGAAVFQVDRPLAFILGDSLGPLFFLIPPRNSCSR